MSDANAEDVHPAVMVEPPAYDRRIHRRYEYDGGGPPEALILDSEEVEALLGLLDICDEAWANLGPPQFGSERDVLRRALDGAS